jgi:hypothetical protein
LVVPQTHVGNGNGLFGGGLVANVLEHVLDEDGALGHILGCMWPSVSSPPEKGRVRGGWSFGTYGLPAEPHRSCGA